MSPRCVTPMGAKPPMGAIARMTTGYGVHTPQGCDECGFDERINNHANDISAAKIINEHTVALRVQAHTHTPCALLRAFFESTPVRHVV